MLIYFSKNSVTKNLKSAPTITYVLNEPALEMFNKSSYTKGDE